MTTIFFERPLALLLIFPAALVVWFLTFRTFIRFHSDVERTTYLKKRRRARWLFALSHLAIAVLLIVALAGPITVSEKTTAGNQRVKIFVDDSRSMELFNTTVAASLRNALEKYFPVAVIGTGESESSALGDFLLRNMEHNDNILFISDGQNNAGKDLSDVLLLAHQLNASVSTVKLTQTASDAWVQVQVPQLSSAGTDTPILVTVKESGDVGPVTLTVKLDGQTWLTQPVTFDSSGTYSLPLKRQLTAGNHEIVASIDARDHFPENNVWYSVIKVENKPKVLFLSTSTKPPILTLLNKLFDVTVSSTLPTDLSGYSSIIIDNMQADELPPTSQIATFVSDGKGLFLIGGPSALDRGGYAGSPFENILPVAVGTPKSDKNQSPNVAIVIDISGSSAAQFSSTSSSIVENVQKNIALGLLGSLKNDTKVTVVAFNQNAYVVAPLAKLSDQPDLVNKILALQTFGGTLIDVGIRQALYALAREPGSKTMIIISDGQTQYQADARTMAAAAAANNVKIYTIGVGQGTDEQFMQQLAQIGHGAYFQPTESQRISLALGAAQQNPDQNSTNSLQIVNFNDFITKDLTLAGSVSGYNMVLPKSSATMLVTLNDGHPILTTWRYGLGRVAVLSTDDGSGWASTLLNNQNAPLISKTVFWTVGDPSAAKDFDVLTTQGVTGQPLTVTVKDTQVPQQQGLTFSKVDQNLYTTTLAANKQGFINILGQTIGINYPPELGALGISPTFLDLIRSSGGTVFDPSDIAGIKKAVVAHSQTTQADSTSWAWIPLSIALALVAIDIVGRRLSQSRQGQ